MQLVDVSWIEKNWVAVEHEPVNEQPWYYRYQLNPVIFSIRYTTPCGLLVEKTATSEELMELLGCLPEPADYTACIMCGYCIMHEDNIIQTVIGSTGIPH
ncbi:hypothetical protein [Spartinivicinus ruber]|uniref:hypothetical protein n=1 Tax=Spartinivicinus ruber TaxID=2683272 RepID=UPI0013D1BD8F|nr:hypothetical protein [Spartinivicinus ruber]